MTYTTLIDVNTLQSEINNPHWLVVDVRYDLMDKQKGRLSFETSHIPNAIYLDLHDDLSGPPISNRGRHPLPLDGTTLELFCKLGINADTQVVIYDNAFGSFAARLWWMLRHYQHEAVAVLDGGWQAWLAENLPVDSSSKSLMPSNFSGKPREDDLITIDQVENQSLLIDSRDPERYRGDVEPIDPKAGHIPGAINRCWKRNLDSSNKFKEKQILRQEFESIFMNKPSSDATFYCGSGVTACHNILAAVHAGLAQPGLYAGSWSEWCNTAGKSVEVGG